ncbi:protein indeterminate-domain 12-like isoform X2 [Telopea speciosissima]|uniref:protein indeterminate-domain 12-like isoform X2 n=1 Tax=Telopea speciosissima TaxID=54955 RepID=UPI001CC64425|nr:protein indeterminate-domain 12-like isoform X2 [Telopea speciosissima]
MLPAATMSNSTSLSEEASVSSGNNRFHDLSSLNPIFSTLSPQQQQKIKKKRNLPGNPDPDAEVIALSPKTLLATNRFVCEICKKGFQRDQNLQLHRRGHNLPWKLRQRTSKEIRKRVYVCPETSCVHHHPSRALGDLTGIKKHFCRKHGEKKWKCEKCSKRYAVQSDCKAHSKTCGTREYKCDCGTLFSRKDSFITHRAFCDALAEESARLSTNPNPNPNPRDHHSLHLHPQNPATPLFPPFSYSTQQRHQQQQQQQQMMMMMMTNPSPPTGVSLNSWDPHQIKDEIHLPRISASPFLQEGEIPKQMMITSPFQQLNMNTCTPHTTNNIGRPPHMSATALLQKAANVGAAAITVAAQAQSVGHMASSITNRFKMDGFNTAAVGSHMGGAGISPEFASGNLATWRKSDRLTRDFLGLAGECCGGGGGGGGDCGGGDEVLMNVNVDVRDDVLSFDGGVEYPPYYHDESLLKTSSTSGFGFAEHSSESEAWGDC